MEKSCFDHVFGKMVYDYSWEKEDVISLFGKQWPIYVVARAFPNRPILDAQRESYIRFIEEFKETLPHELIMLLLDYVRKQEEKLDKITEDDLATVVTPESLLFKQDGVSLLLFDCTWDEEHGIAVQFYPEIKIGPQDLFL